MGRVRIIIWELFHLFLTKYFLNKIIYLLLNRKFGVHDTTSLYTGNNNPTGLAASSVLNSELFRQRSSSGVGNGEENEKARERKGENREKNCESWGKESSQREQEDLRRRWHRRHSGIIYISLNRIYFRKKQMGVESWMMLCIWFRSWAYRRRRLRRRKFTSTKMSLRRRLAPTVPYCSFLLLTYFFSDKFLSLTRVLV